MINVSAQWRKRYDGACAGALIIERVVNPLGNSELDRKKQQIEAELRTRFKDRDGLRSHHVLVAYKDYYKRFKKTYHVQQQVESIVFKGKSIPNVACLVEAMFMAELHHMLLTAGHDLDLVEPPLTLNASKGDETFVKMNGEAQVLKEGDMFICDSVAPLSSVIYGPDARTRIRAETTRVLFTVYGVPGIGEGTVREHLEEIAENVSLFSPEAAVTCMDLYR
ncbi:MAG: phenylalanine--tRNA ligase beta subunit-related protein [Thermodesulfobacteriota bacterium]